MFLNLSWPAVSQICSLMVLWSQLITLDLKSTPIVAVQDELNRQSVNLVMSEVFPTPPSPMTSILARWSCYFLDVLLVWLVRMSILLSSYLNVQNLMENHRSITISIHQVLLFSNDTLLLFFGTFLVRYIEYFFLIVKLLYISMRIFIDRRIIRRRNIYQSQGNHSEKKSESCKRDFSKEWPNIRKEFRLSRKTESVQMSFIGSLCSSTCIPSWVVCFVVKIFSSLIGWWMKGPSLGPAISPSADRQVLSSSRGSSQACWCCPAYRHRASASPMSPWGLISGSSMTLLHAIFCLHISFRARSWGRSCRRSGSPVFLLKTLATSGQLSVFLNFLLVPSIANQIIRYQSRNPSLFARFLQNKFIFPDTSTLKAIIASIVLLQISIQKKVNQNWMNIPQIIPSSQFQGSLVAFGQSGTSRISVHYDLSDQVSEKSSGCDLGTDSFFGNFVAMATMLFYTGWCQQMELLLVSQAGILNWGFPDARFQRSSLRWQRELKVMVLHTFLVNYQANLSRSTPLRLSFLFISSNIYYYSSTLPSIDQYSSIKLTSWLKAFSKVDSTTPMKY